MRAASLIVVATTVALILALFFYVDTAEAAPKRGGGGGGKCNIKVFLFQKWNSGCNQGVKITDLCKKRRLFG